MAWDGIVAVDLFMAGLGAWVYIYAVYLGHGKPGLAKAGFVGSIVAWICVLIGVLTLMVDAKAGLLHPTRLFGLLTNFGSVMTWGVMFISAFMLIVLVDVVLRWRKKASPLGLQVAGCIFAFCVSAYTGMLLSASVAVPLWNRAVLPLLFIASAACTGAAAMYLVVRFAEKDELGEAGALHKAMFWTAVCVAVLTTMLLVVANGATGQMQHAGTSAVASIVSGSFAPLFWAGIVALGMVVPIVGEGTRVLKARTSAEGTALVMAQCVSVLIGGFCLRYAIVCAAVSIGMLW